MREILFRAINIETNKWVYGSFIDHLEMIKNEHLDFDIDVHTLGQYTGLEDKNGTKIFEGDIVKLEKDFWLSKNNYVLIKENENYEVYYDNKCARFDLKTEDTDFEFKQVAWKQLISEIVEVIGNIHDNPELLEVTND